MKGNDLWERYCSFDEKDFSEQMEYNRERMERYFRQWRKTYLAKMLCQGSPEGFRDVPATTYSDYPMLSSFSQKMEETIAKNPRMRGELFKEYYDRVSPEIGSTLNRYMTEPFHLCMKTAGTTGESKWLANGETFWKNFASNAMSTIILSCSDGWGETKIKNGDKCLNVTAPIPFASGWGAWACHRHFKLIPPIEATDNVRHIKETYLMTLKAIKRGDKIVAGGGSGSMFYMMCRYLVEPEEFFQEYYCSMKFGLSKILLRLKLLQYKLSKKQKKTIRDFMPFKGVIISGIDARLYVDFFRKEFDLEPFHVYGATESGNVMRGDPDRKTDLVPDLRTSYLEFKTEDGEIKELDGLKKGEVYDLVVTPFGSILFRYDMEDFFEVVDFRDDGMPVFAFAGRKMEVVDIYNYRATPNVFVRALYNAGLRSSDKWAVTKILKPTEHLHFLMEKTWPYSEREAEKIIFNSLMETIATMPDTVRTLRDYVASFGIRDPSELVTVEYLKPGAFLRYSVIKAKMGSPMGQYKPPRIIPTEKMEIYDTLRSA
jgi:hypothetical protein